MVLRDSSLLSLHSKIIPERLGGTIWDAGEGMEPGLAMCRVNALPAVQSLQLRKGTSYLVLFRLHFNEATT